MSAGGWRGGWWRVALVALLGGLAPARDKPSPGPEEVTFVKGGVTLRLLGLDRRQADELKRELLDQITLAGQAAPTEPLADDLSFFALQHLLHNGHPRALVRWRLEGRVVELQVELGERVRLGTLSWEGELPLPEEELKRYFLRPVLERPDMDKKAPYWIEADAQAGAALVARRLRAEGYLDAQCDLKKNPGADPLSQDVTLSVRAGARYVMGQVTLAGVPSLLEPPMQAVSAEFEGGAFSEGRLQALERRLTDAASQRGWLGATAVSAFERPSAGGAVNVRVQVDPGQRPVIGRVAPDATFSRGAQRVLKAAFRPLVGQHWSDEAVEQVYRRLLDTGMFAMLEDHLETDPSGTPAAGAAPGLIRVEGEETRPHTLGLEAALDTFLGFQIGLNYRNTNLLDTGRILAAAANYSLAGPTGFVSLSDPALFNTAYVGTVRVSGDYFIRYEYARYTLALDMDISRRLTRHLSWSVHSAISVNAVASDLPPDWIGPDAYAYYSAGMSLLLDYRDNAVLPKKGWFLSLRGDYNLDAVGEGASFLRHEARAAWLVPLTDKWRLAVGGTAESLQGAAFTDIPIDSRVFNGGPNSVRAFAMRELGPVTEGGTPLGGTAALFASVELSREILPNLELAVFLDTGSLDLRRVDHPFQFSSDLRHGVGAGLRYLLPFGPLRLDYGYNLDRREGEAQGRVHVTAGFAF